MGKPKAATAATSHHFAPRRGKRDAFFEKLLEAATSHGENSEPDHEVGDLQELADDLWRLMTDEQRDVIRTDPHWQNFIDQWWGGA